MRVEDPGDTFLAFANGISWVIRVPFRTKQAGFQALAARGKSRKQAKPLLFAACVFLLVKEHLDQIDRLLIDNEYDGHADLVKAAVLRHIRQHVGTFSTEKIRITSIGKKSPAHQRALAAKRGRGNPADRSITPREIREVLGK